MALRPLCRENLQCKTDFPLKYHSSLFNHYRKRRTGKIPCHTFVAVKSALMITTMIRSIRPSEMGGLMPLLRFEVDLITFM